MLLQHLKRFFQKPGLFMLGDYHPDDIFKMVVSNILKQSHTFGLEQLFIEMIDSQHQAQLDQILAQKSSDSHATLDSLLANWHYTPQTVPLIKDIIYSAQQSKVKVIGINHAGDLQTRNNHWESIIVKHHQTRSLILGGKAHIGEINEASPEWECAPDQGIDARLKAHRFNWLAAAPPLDTREAFPLIPRSEAGIQIEGNILILPNRLDRVSLRPTLEMPQREILHQRARLRR